MRSSKNCRTAQNPVSQDCEAPEARAPVHPPFTTDHDPTPILKHTEDHCHSSSIPSRTLLRLGIINTWLYKIWAKKDDVTFLEVPVSHPGCSGRWPPAQRSLLSAHPSASPAPRLSAGCSATLSSMWPRFHLGPSPARSAWLLPPRHASPAPLCLSSQPTVKGSIESLIISTKISIWRF